MLRLLSISNVGMSVWCILFFGYDIHASGAFVGVSIGLVALSISLFGVLGLILTLFPVSYTHLTLPTICSV